ncbi:fructose-bisphosphate aldolase, class II [Austwickia chelonae]|uniref:Putative ketose-bisphosphate aldolase n=1 Tax=Austwickia chelonae NBRC 105200 TaxID=1184607 RepID=K6VML0_9MICO|nr:class II fructose-bisphosphate aldolase [Austwickia chelonae]GAB77964.1 putative ketose-bisphosphate aldolase [Austwickia chelonae NBRC 105200]SEV93205.1 fructose-bisphosphate aldolase, class II [Austwickia chelonae]
MSLATLSDVLAPAYRTGRGVGAFNVIQVEHAEALVAAASDTGLPVVLQISENCVKYHGGLLTPIAAATRELADQAPVPCVLHLDHATDLELIAEAVDFGFTSVMYDGSRLPDEENRKNTGVLAANCRDRGVSLEAELGEIGGKDGAHSPGARTDPAEAARFVADTGVDALAVAVGSSHAMTERTARLDLELIAQIRRAIPVPLVLHGSSGVPDELLSAAVRAGMTKINIATHLNVVFSTALRDYLAENPGTVDTRKFFGPARHAVRAESARLMNLLAAV